MGILARVQQHPPGPPRGPVAGRAARPPIGDTCRDVLPRLHRPHAARIGSRTLPPARLGLRGEVRRLAAASRVPSPSREATRAGPCLKTPTSRVTRRSFDRLWLLSLPKSLFRHCSSGVSLLIGVVAIVAVHLPKGLFAQANG